MRASAQREAGCRWWPFFVALVLVLAMVTCVPGLVLFLPELI